MKKIACILLCISLSTGIFAQTQWKVDGGHTDIRFTVTHMMISEVDGEFSEFTGTVNSPSEDFTGSEVAFTAQAASVDTDNERRDNHLKGPDFFDAESFPEISFSGKIEKEGDKHYLVGEFTMKGVTKPIKFDVKYNGQVPGRRGKKAGFKIKGTVNRFAYNLKWDRAMEAGGLVVGEDVEITCNVELNEVVASDN